MLEKITVVDYNLRYISLDRIELNYKKYEIGGM